MAVDRGLVIKEIFEQLTATAAVTALLGNPPRIYLRPPETAVFPWVRMDCTAAPYLTGYLGGNVNPKWIRQLSVTFVAFDLTTGILTVTAIQKAIADVMDRFPGIATITNCKLGQCLPGTETADYDPETRTAYAVLEYTMSMEDTT